jgi:cytochrome c biogenesis protein CcmG/thiol:disulfide interchange protein DsbE
MAGVGITVFVGSLVVVFASRFGSDPLVAPSPLIDQQVAAVPLQLLGEEGSLVLSDLRGEVVVVNFWASWCLPCRAEFPYLNAAARQYQDRGVRFVGVVYQEGEGNALAFLEEVGWPDGYYHAIDPESKAAIEFGVYGIPETFVIDREGVIRHKITGGVNGATLQAALAPVIEPSL